MIAKSSCLALLVNVVLILTASGTPQDHRATTQEMLRLYSEKVRWQNYWLPNTVSKLYVSQSVVRVEALFGRSAAGFCIAALTICQIYQVHSAGALEFLTEWRPEVGPSGSLLPRRFKEEYVKARALEIIPVIGLDGHKPAQRTFDPANMSKPLQGRATPEVFEDLISFDFKLVTLTPPKAIAEKIRPSDVAALHAEISATAKRFDSGCGAASEATIPFYDRQDPRVFVYVDLGGKCEKGVLEFLKGSNGNWSFNRFIVDNIDLELLVPRIEKARMEVLRIEH